MNFPNENSFLMLRKDYLYCLCIKFPEFFIEIKVSTMSKQKRDSDTKSSKIIDKDIYKYSRQNITAEKLWSLPVSNLYKYDKQPSASVNYTVNDAIL